MSEASFAIKMVLVGFLIGTALGAHTGKTVGREDGYRAGQIDAANGRMIYHKVRNADGEEVWTKEK